jgi:hypothetical protein
MLNEKQFKLLQILEVPKYIYQIQVSKNRNTKYFHQDSGRGKTKKLILEIPKKYKAWGYDLEGYAVDYKNQRIISNPVAAGKPRFVSVNSQVLYSSSGQYTRALVMKTLHAYWVEQLSKIPAFLNSQYPLFIWIDWYAPNEHKTQDIDNFTYIVEKAFFDALQESEIIPNDTVNYICGQASKFHEINDFEDRKLVIKFYQFIDKNQIKLL